MKRRFWNDPLGSGRRPKYYFVEIGTSSGSDRRPACLFSDLRLCTSLSWEPTSPTDRDPGHRHPNERQRTQESGLSAPQRWHEVPTTNMVKCPPFWLQVVGHSFGDNRQPVIRVVFYELQKAVVPLRLVSVLLYGEVVLPILVFQIPCSHDCPYVSLTLSMLRQPSRFTTSVNPFVRVHFFVFLSKSSLFCQGVC